MHLSLFRLTSALVLSLSLAWGGSSIARADSTETVPPEIRELVAGIEAAANDRDLDLVLAYYATDFIHDDNLSRNVLARGLEQLWSRYPRFDYRTELVSWERDGEAIVVETMTRARGLGADSGRPIRLLSEVRSRQRFEQGKIVFQEILSERTQLLLGENPPAIRVNAPDTVGVGDRFNFDVIVTEPLEDLLLGTAIEEEVAGLNYINDTSFNLDLLAAGGIFRVGTAPDEPQDRWLSAVLVREDGIAIVTHRLRVVAQTSER